MKTLFFILSMVTANIVYCQNLTESDLLDFIATSNLGNFTEILQIGDNNAAIVEANQIQLKQNGDNQEFYYTETSSQPNNVNVEMNGTNNYLEILGNNQIIENMSITVNGDYKSIIINNYP